MILQQAMDGYTVERRAMEFILCMGMFGDKLYTNPAVVKDFS